MPYLLDKSEVAPLSRPISKHLEDNVLETYIREVEEMVIRPTIGASFYRYLLESKDDEIPSVEILLNGGWYPSTFDETFDGTFREGGQGLDEMCSGLKKCIAYYVLAKIVKGNDAHITRYGLSQKENEYGNRPSAADKESQYRDLANMGDKYLQDTLQYLNEYRSLYPEYVKCCGRLHNTRQQYRIIGD